ncbi:cyclic nucleotide-binding domain-containing protein [Cellvibrio sp. KY-GH-1]|uniref:cyclic nucleotide-binding domain-containing protein n=1 Tax=Cellvibrio sp. KY-GH-1 TaxID=2303332 RepID=UPI001248E4AC|nr:cyclic nucleotide-binding domain-containing protein [Cellvibrio sp. KY-GH-1]QEY16584.1 cyclic nucleotide-binding domain-containing protein [Cellvibrio sp. KY-GH-1]
MMETKPLHKIPKDTLEHLLSGIPFFKVVKQQDAKQLEILLQASRILSFVPGEVVLQKGDTGNWLYFLLKGKLAVYVDQALKGDLVNYVTPGEVFGDLAQLVGQARTATVISDASAKESMVLALDFNVFGPLNSVTPISLQTKLAYYRNTAHNLRWKLEVYRSQHLQHELANKHRQIKLYHGPKDSHDELVSLYEQSQALALLLMEWNKEFGVLAAESLG